MSHHAKIIGSIFFSACWLVLSSHSEVANPWNFEPLTPAYTYRARKFAKMANCMTCLCLFTFSSSFFLTISSYLWLDLFLLSVCSCTSFHFSLIDWAGLPPLLIGSLEPILLCLLPTQSHSAKLSSFVHLTCSNCWALGFWSLMASGPSVSVLFLVQLASPLRSSFTVSLGFASQCSTFLGKTQAHPDLW